MTTRRQFIESSVLAAAGLAVAPRYLWAQGQQPAPVNGTFTALRNNVGIFSASGGTIGWLMAPDGVVVVDTQFPDTAQQCLDGIKSKSTRPIDLLINTHHHGDHTGGNGVFKPHVGAIVAHKNVPGLQQKAAAPNAQGQTPPPPVVADKTYDTTWEQQLGKETVRLKYYGPAHTGGDSVVTFVNANVVHMGDLVFHKMVPFIDLPGGASIAGWIQFLEKAKAAYPKDATYVYGHASEGNDVVGGQDALDGIRAYLSGLLDYVKKGKAAGKTAEELAKVERIPGHDEVVPMWDGAIKSNVDAAWEELSR